MASRLRTRNMERIKTSLFCFTVSTRFVVLFKDASPGWCGSRAHFDRNVGALSEAYTVYAIDHRFHGGSERPSWVPLGGCIINWLCSGTLRLSISSWCGELNSASRIESRMCFVEGGIWVLECGDDWSVDGVFCDLGLLHALWYI